MTPLQVMARAFDIRYRLAAPRFLMISNAARVISIANRLLLSRASTASPLIRSWVIDFAFIAAFKAPDALFSLFPNCPLRLDSIRNEAETPAAQRSLVGRLAVVAE
jgi:hypothetical protein